MNKITLVRQTTQNECGLCCISMVAGFYGFKKPISYFRNRFNIGRDGISLKTIYDILHSIGLNVKAYNIRDFNDYEFTSQPYIVHFKSSHFVVVKKDSKNRLFCWDPACEKSEISYKELSEKSTGYCLVISKSENFIESKNYETEFRHFIPAIKSVLPTFLLVLLVSLMAYTVSILIPLIMQNTINNIIYKNSLNLYDVFLEMISIIFVFLIISLFRNKAMLKLQLSLYESISFKSVGHLFKIKYSFFDNRSPGDILFRLDFLTQIQDTISGTLVQLLVSLTSIITILAYFFIKYIQLVPYILTIISVLSVIVLLINKHLLYLKQQEVRCNRKNKSIITEIVDNMYQIKCLHLEEYFFNAFKNSFSIFKKAFSTSQKNTQKFNLMLNAIFTFLPVFILLFLMSSQNGKMFSVGELFAIYSFLTTIFTQSLSFTIGISSLLMLKATLFYLNDFLDEDEIVEQNKKLILNTFESLNINNINFKYSDTSKNTLECINLLMKRGECIAIVGVSGSGKTTLAKLLAGLYRVTSGEININGINIENIKNETYSNIISIVPQVPVIFNKSIKDNITLEDSSISDLQVIYALKLANFWEEINQMPLGINTIISGQGGNLSGGQIQRISIARALVRSPQLLILDEATSSLDPRNERKIYMNIQKENISQIIISHHLSTIMYANQIYVLDKGHIVECGNYSYLMKLNGLYARLFNEQSKIIR